MKQMLDIYSDYLLTSFSYTKATGLSRLTDGEINHDQVTRFLSSEMKTSLDLWLMVKPFQRRIESLTGVLIIDRLKKSLIRMKMTSSVGILTTRKSGQTDNILELP